MLNAIASAPGVAVTAAKAPIVNINKATPAEIDARHRELAEHAATEQKPTAGRRDAGSLDEQAQVDKAIEAFGSNGFLLFVGDEQVDDLDAVLDPHAEPARVLGHVEREVLVEHRHELAGSGFGLSEGLGKGFAIRVEINRAAGLQVGDFHRRQPRFPGADTHAMGAAFIASEAAGDQGSLEPTWQFGVGEFDEASQRLPRRSKDLRHHTPRARLRVEDAQVRRVVVQHQRF